VTFQVPAYAVDGNSENGNFLRLMLQSATLGSQGVVGHLDCQVTQTGTPSAGIIIGSGAVVILGQEASFQGSYYGYNTGNDTTLTIAATGASPRSDMIIVRAEDPTWSGSPWGNPASGQIVFPRVLSGVSSGATSVPGGNSAIALARIDIPATTSAITNAMIHDLRTVCNPQQLMIMEAQNGSTPAHASTAGTTNVQWPTGAVWSVAIPVWATTFVFSWTVSEVLYNNDGNGFVRGNVWPIFGSSVTSPTLTTPQTQVSIPAASGPWRHTFSGGGTVSIPASLRGTTQTLQFVQVADGTNTATLNYGEGASTTLTGQFQQLSAAA
jgi:hypothetical protein